jgi:hypothetical protein
MSALVNTELRSSLTVPTIVPLPVCAAAGVNQNTLHKVVAKKSECRDLRITLHPIFVFLFRLAAESHDELGPLPGLRGLHEDRTDTGLWGTVSREGERRMTPV